MVRGMPDPPFQPDGCSRVLAGARVPLGWDPNTCYDIANHVSTGVSDPNIFGSVIAPPTTAQVQSYLQGLPSG